MCSSVFYAMLYQYEKFPTDVIVRAQPKGWMTTDLKEDWTKVVWGARPGSLRIPKGGTPTW